MLSGKGAKNADGTTTIALEDYQMVAGRRGGAVCHREGRPLHGQDRYLLCRGAAFREAVHAVAADAAAVAAAARRTIRTTSRSARRRSSRRRGTSCATAPAIRRMRPIMPSSCPKCRSKLKDQAASLAKRMQARELSGTNESFKSFTENMKKAVEAMGPATEKLKGRSGRMRSAPEQKALQYLLRAEATFRQIQVSFGRQRGGGGGGGASGATRDLEGLFDLELDTEKNQYETAQQGGGRRSRSRRRSTKRCRSWNSSPSGSRNWPSSASRIRRLRSSAGSRKCCGARPSSCSRRCSS